MGWGHGLGHGWDYDRAKAGRHMPSRIAKYSALLVTHLVFVEASFHS